MWFGSLVYVDIMGVLVQDKALTHNQGRRCGKEESDPVARIVCLSRSSPACVIDYALRTTLSAR